MIQQDTNNQVAFLSTTPNLAISSTTTLVKYAATMRLRANGRMSPAVTTADAPSLALATRKTPNAPVAGSLDFDDGTAPKANALACRVYSLIATVPEASVTATPTFSWLAGEDFTLNRQMQASDIPQPNQSNQVVVGYVFIKNASTAAFVPGTTALTGVSGLSVLYFDNYAVAGN